MKRDNQNTQEKFVCTECGEEFDREELTAFDGALLCRSCLEDATTICRCCGVRIWRSDAIDDDLCQSCYDDDYTRCSDCGSVINYDDAYYTSGDESDHDYPYCYRCYHNHENHTSIHDYYYKPEPIFYGDDKLYYGVELEIDRGGEDDENADCLLDTANYCKEHMYIKHDSSIDDGFECVSHPMTLEYHKNNMPWERILRNAVSMGYRSHQAETCGLHIHINRSGLGYTYDEQECTIAKILYFYEKFWDEILRFSRRTASQAERWARRYGGGLINPSESLIRAKRSGFGRYMAVNLENTNTVEMRIFRGTLKYGTFMATLQLVDEICRAAVSLSDDMLQSMTWLDFVQRIPPEKNELLDYLKIRRLYVNEPVEEDEEI